MKLKACHLSSVHRELDSRVYYRECVSIARAGAEVCLIAPYAGPAPDGQVRIVCHARHKNRFLRMLLSPLILVPAVKEHADIYHFHAVELIPAALALKLLFRKRVIYDIHEDFPSMMLLKPYVPKVLRGLLSRLVQCAEHVSSRLFDGIVTADPFVLERFDHVPPERKMIFYNLPSPDVFKNGVERAGKPYDIVYLGGMSERSGTFFLLRVIRRLVDAGVGPRVALAGYTDNGASLAAIKRTVGELGLTGLVEVHGRIPHKEAPLFLCQGRIGVVPLQPVPKFQKNIASKIFEYWACGLPVVAGDLRPTRLFLREGEFGLIVGATDEEAFAGALRRLLEHPDEAEAMGQAARKAVRDTFNCRAEGEKLVQFYRRMVAHG